MSWKAKAIGQIPVTTQTIKLIKQQEQAVKNNLSQYFKPNLLIKTIKTGKPPLLEHDLESVITTKGPVFLKCPKTKTFNFDSLLQFIPQRLDLINISKISSFKKPSQDLILHQMAMENGSRFYSSTSSIVPVLSLVTCLIRNSKSVSRHALPFNFQDKSNRLSSFNYDGTLIKLNKSGDLWSIDKQEVRTNVPEGLSLLADLGHFLEFVFTNPTRDFKRVEKTNNEPVDIPQAYNYMSAGSMLLRSQIDAIDKKGRPFDLKTRATSPIRHDLINYKTHTDYRISKIEGLHESFEREKKDLITAAFLKFSLQARIGSMHGMFLAYHNTLEIFGFEYITLREMERVLYGQSEFGTPIFQMSVQLTNSIFEEIIKVIGNESSVYFATPRNGMITVYASKDFNDLKNQKVHSWRVRVSSSFDDIFKSSLPQNSNMNLQDKWKLYYDIEYNEPSLDIFSMEWNGFLARSNNERSNTNQLQTGNLGTLRTNFNEKGAHKNIDPFAREDAF